MIRSQRIRDSARDQDCQMHSPACNGDSRTVVWCHSNHSDHGKGLGLKAHDIFGFYGCSGCHEWYDLHSKRQGVPEDERRWYYQRAHDRSLVLLIEQGVVKV